MHGKESRTEPRTLISSDYTISLVWRLVFQSCEWFLLSLTSCPLQLLMLTVKAFAWWYCQINPTGMEHIVIRWFCGFHCHLFSKNSVVAQFCLLVSLEFQKMKISFINMCLESTCHSRFWMIWHCPRMDDQFQTFLNQKAVFERPICKSKTFVSMFLYC